ncbi:MAG TPA: hypothetical protein PLE45_02875 [Spirochaetota bacterium]|nr:hypothetical protein [Spirochaetota bacterium]HOL56662.1 hypothetical protein [Spirochaetota bacterium]HPP05349.1 hypothetical protein [Spirochaetota bacterium]
MKKGKLAKDLILFFVISESLAFSVIFLLLYYFMGLNFSKILKESIPPIIISFITYGIVSYIIYNLIKPITLIEEGNAPLDKEVIIKTGNKLGIFFIIINIIGFIMAPGVAVVVRIIIDGFLRWSTLRLFTICSFTGILMGIFQYLYSTFKIRNLKIELNIIEFDSKKSILGLKSKVFLITLLLATFLGVNFYLFVLANEEKVAGISHFAILNKEADEKNQGYFTKLLELAKKSEDTQVREEA